MCVVMETVSKQAGVRGRVWYKQRTQKTGLQVQERERRKAGFKAQLCH